MDIKVITPTIPPPPPSTFVLTLSREELLHLAKANAVYPCGAYGWKMHAQFENLFNIKWPQKLEDLT
jgi:hypothetical protein